MPSLGRRLCFVGVALFAGATTGCRIGEGSGSADGPMWILGCLEGQPWAPEDAPKDFHLSPTFFAGEPIEDIADTNPMNRIIIRMQRNGNATEINDTLYFDIRDSAQIARCLRGRTVNGVPDWDTTSGMVTPDPMAPPWCEPPAAGNTLPRIHLFPFAPVASSFAPLGSCHSSMHPPAIVNIAGVANDGWIDFQDFGSAELTNQETIAPDERPMVAPAFQVKYGERLRATFHIDMGDERVAAAKRDKVLPPPDATIGGVLDGNFDFDLERGRSAQTFP